LDFACQLVQIQTMALAERKAHNNKKTAKRKAKESTITVSIYNFQFIF
jgi:hypothetical protein